ncbi:MAG: hypothetical protein KF773_15715 [Deltaproteobacteria bacterium]|nr:hypothetical protein [Deltaproteobacteria bacterium]MCW5802632.1 hypothetical protein [Deltaproteobacteria bacterium]
MGVALALSLASTGCQPLYGAKPEKLRNPEKKKRPPPAPDAVVEIKYLEDCQTNFRDDPKRVSRDTTGSNSLVETGDNTLAQADKTKEPQSQAQLISVAIDKYINALKKDPYNAEATLKLALAYDRVLRKGCALKLLARLPLLEANQTYRSRAKQAADQVSDSKEWFRGYRKEAVAAAGR